MKKLSSFSNNHTLAQSASMQLIVDQENNKSEIAENKQQVYTHKTTHNTLFQPNINQTNAYTLKSLKGDEIMTVNGLINEFIKPHEHSFKLRGAYGHITMTPEHHGNAPDTYHVDCCYSTLGNIKTEQHADGFRLSTACCLSACIIFGEQKVNEQMIESINIQLN